MKLGKFTVAYSAQALPNDKFYGVASVVWDDGGQTFDELWAFDNKTFDTAGEALEFAAKRTTELYAGGSLGAPK